MESMSRRNFVKAAGAAAAAVAASSIATGVVMAEEADFAQETGVIIIGGGAAGLMASVSCHEAGVPAILLEKAGFTGGDTTVSNNVILGWWPEQQEKNGVTGDSGESYLEDWKKSHYISVKGLAGEELGETPFNERLCLHGHEAWQWIVDNTGLEFAPSTAISVMMPAPSWDTHPCRRWKVIPNDKGRITENITAVLETYEDVEIKYQTEARSLIKDADGRVCGVRVLDKDNNIYDIKATNGVIVSSGSFIGNSALVNKYLGTDYARCVSGGLYVNGGDGLRMCLDAGADTTDITLGAHTFMATLGTYDVWPVHDHMGKYGEFDGALGLTDPAIYINYEGKRFAPESNGYSCAGKAVLQQPNGIAFYVFDSNNLDQELVEYKNQILMSGETLEELALNMNVPVDAFVAEIERYNGFVDAGVDEDFGKYMNTATRIEQAPFYAIPVICMPYANYGGVKIDIENHVIGTDGEIIPGLYAAGTVTGIYAEQEGLFYCGGVQQGLFYGMQAGRNAAAMA